VDAVKNRLLTQIPRWVQVKRVEGLAGHKFDHYAPITWQVNGAASEPDAFQAGKPQGWGTGFARERLK